MPKRPSDVQSSDTLTLRQFERFFAGWITDGKIRQLSHRTLEEREFIQGKFLWWARQQELEEVDPLAVRQFLAYVATGHQQPGGRWGNERLTQPLRATGALTYFRILRAFYNWLCEERPGFENPLGNLRPPRIPKDQVQPFTTEQVEALRAAAGRSRTSRRDTALVLFLLDTGARCQEVCALQRADIDVVAKQVTLRGKGGKTRTVYFGRETGKALWAWVSECAEDGPLFPASTGKNVGGHLNPNGLHQIIQRLGEAAAVQGVRCSPHTFRHTFAISFLRSGGNIFTLKELLGHTSLSMTQRYLAVAQADLEAQHRLHSPVDRLKKRR